MADKNVVFFGTGQNADRIEQILLPNIKIIAYLDNNKKIIGNFKNGIKIISVNELDFEYDAVILTSMLYEDMAEQLICTADVRPDKIVAFFDIDDIENNRKCREYFDSDDRNMLCVSEHLRKLRANYETRYANIIRNISYEIKDKLDEIQTIKVHSIDDTIDYIVNSNVSVGRYGDGEFDIMQMNDVESYQSPNRQLVKRLEEVLAVDEEGFIQCIPDNYGSLEEQDVKAADNIRNKMTPESRAYQYKLLDKNKTYYNAFVSRLYSIIENKGAAAERFQRLRKLWDSKNIVLIEGEYTKCGVGNDLFSNAAVIRRIIAPAVNAFDKYDQILATAQDVNGDDIILIALGPTATILAYDLFKSGHRAIDIGHLDLEYEWALRGKNRRVHIPGKYNEELFGGRIVKNLSSEEYEKQIIARCL